MAFGHSNAGASPVDPRQMANVAGCASSVRMSINDALALEWELLADTNAQLNELEDRLFTVLEVLPANPATTSPPEHEPKTVLNKLHRNREGLEHLRGRIRSLTARLEL